MENVMQICADLKKMTNTGFAEESISTKMRLQKQFLVRVRLLNRGCQRNAFSFAGTTKNVC